jgi:hypothetical protein
MTNKIFCEKKDCKATIHGLPVLYAGHVDVLQHQLLIRESTFSAKNVHQRFLFKCAINDAAKETCNTCKVFAQTVQ